MENNYGILQLKYYIKQIRIDATKITNSVMMLVDNSIVYERGGGVYI